VVINEVYGGGGNSGAAFNRDFIELVNKTTATVDLAGWSVQYASAVGTSWTTKTNLTGTIPAGGRFVVGGAGGANGASFTTDLDGGINLSGSAGKVALVNTQTALPGTTCTDACSDLPQVVDFVG
jgi:5'-nucleotidase